MVAARGGMAGGAKAGSFGPVCCGWRVVMLPVG